MRKLLLRALFFLIPFLYSIYASSQPGKDRDCSTTCFSSEVVSVSRISDTCASYELKVSFSGKCAHALSHFTVAVPCGKIEDLWNSENWAQVVGTDPTTGLTGFKIDGIPNFGETSLRNFTVKFTVCSMDEGCSQQMSCWQPLVAFKASTCVNYRTLPATCRQNLKAVLVKRDVSCFGAHDGSLSVAVEEGREPFSYLWSDRSTGESLTGLSEGAYSVIIRDASGAELTLGDFIQQPEQILLSGITTPATCNGLADGSIDLTASGGAGNYSFAWNNGEQTEDILALASGNYSVVVTDAANCSAKAAFTIGNTSNITIISAQIRPDCNDSNGSINTSVTGGKSPYTYAWSNGSTAEDLENISAGLYSLTVTDNSGCSQKASFFITENNTLLLTGTSSPTTCADDASGLIELTASGGTAPYSYSWSNHETSEDISGLTSGFYTVKVTDAKGCTATAGFTVAKNTFQVTRTIKQPSCHGQGDGSITLDEPLGGTGPFTYEWSNGETGTAVTGLSPGLYSVVIKDATGCSRTMTFSINNPPGIVAVATVSNSQCNAEGYFSIDLNVSGGVAPYTFDWSQGSTSKDVDNLQSGTYTIVVTDANGCSISEDVLIEKPAESLSCLINDFPGIPACNSVNNELSASVTDADSYLWTVESTDGTWSISSANSPTVLFSAGGENSSATFSLTLEKDGCTKTCTYTVSACSVQDDGEGGGPPEGGDTGNGGGDSGDQTCAECFGTLAKLVKEDGACRAYEMTVTTDGHCRHELSHWTIAIPCGIVTDYSNSEGWKMEVGKDPTTGLSGLKVDGINTFGKEVDSFTVRFTVCGPDECKLASWHPLVAYKAGLCVATETVEISRTSSEVAGVSVYPNPFVESISFEWNKTDENASLQIIDQYGSTVYHKAKAACRGDACSMMLESVSLPRGVYYYRLTVAGKTYSGKISKR